MEFLLIGDSKLKVVMSGEDMTAFKLDGKTDSSSPVFRRDFWRVLDLAKEQVGFDPDGDKILIQFYPIKNGGCEVFVTKLGILPKESAKTVTRSDNITMLSRERRTYAFDTKADLSNFLKLLKSGSFEHNLKMDIYRASSALYYLLIEEFSQNDIAEIAAIYEYARPLNSDTEYFVTEHLEWLADEKRIEESDDFI